MSAEQRERPLHELLSRDMVDIYVGPENTHWILHEKLLCHRSRFFRSIFYGKPRKNGTGSSNSHAYGLPDDDDAPFKLFVGWLYSERVPAPTSEKELGPLLDLYLMGERWEVRQLVVDVLAAVRRFYRDSDSWPSLRRVQYVYANTEPASAMRQLLVQCAARMLVVGAGAKGGENGGEQGAGTEMPVHWEKALRKNGELAVDVIMCVQKWHFAPESVPDARIDAAEALVDAADERKRQLDESDEQSPAAPHNDTEQAEQAEWASGLSQSQTEADSEHTA